MNKLIALICLLVASIEYSIAQQTPHADTARKATATTSSQRYQQKKICTTSSW